MDKAKDAIGARSGSPMGKVQSLQPATESATEIAAGGTESSLVDSLTSQLGVTPEQAEGGAGSLFQVAKQKLEPESFQSIANVVPGMDGLLGAAPKTPAVGGLAGSVPGIGGDSVGSGLGALSLANNFQQLGLSPDMVGKFIAVVVDYVKSQGGATVANLLGGALPGF